VARAVASDGAGHNPNDWLEILLTNILAIRSTR
jgi:hypothetical protein